MFEDIRRQLEKKRMKGLEKERRLSYSRMKRLEERRSVEEGLREQVGSELTAREAAKRSLQERRQAEKELRVSRGPGVGMRVAKGVGRAAKGVFYTLPVTSVRAASKLGKGTNLNRVLIGDTQLLFGPQTKQPQTGQTHEGRKKLRRHEREHRGHSAPMNEFIFGKPTSTSSPRDKSPGIFDIGGDILK